MHLLFRTPNSYIKNQEKSDRKFDRWVDTDEISQPSYERNQRSYEYQKYEKNSDNYSRYEPMSVPITPVRLDSHHHRQGNIDTCLTKF